MSTLPLYRTSSPLATQRPDSAHAGLWYDKFAPWNLDADGRWREPTFDKPGWVKHATAKKVGQEAQLREMIARRERLLLAQGGLALWVKTQGRFVTGLGYPHAVENGFAWHPTLGTPYLPGSGLKGVTRAYAKLFELAPSTDLDRIFGPRSGPGIEHREGTVIFLEAIPCEPVALVAEVMTPHYSPYYQNGKPPADYHKPNPIPFLAVETGVPFLAGVLPRHKQNAEDAKRAQAAEDAKRAQTWLLKALEDLGAGAKTATGYGRFERDEARQRVWDARAEEERRRTGPPIERMRHLIEGLSEGKLYQMVHDYLDKGGLTNPAEIQAFRSAVMDTNFFAAWKKGEPVDRKKPPAGKPKLKDIAKRIAGDSPT